MRQTGSIRLKATFANENSSLWPGQFLDVSLLLTTEPHAVVVPSLAVQAGQQGPYRVRHRRAAAGRTAAGHGGAHRRDESVIASGITPAKSWSPTDSCG
jgi:multidrug efflux system membrane fusion protein